jgi:hypothetical protein
LRLRDGDRTDKVIALAIAGFLRDTPSGDALLLGYLLYPHQESALESMRRNP